MPLDQDVDQDKVAAVTHGFVGADLEYLCKEAAMKCLPQVQKDMVGGKTKCNLCVQVQRKQTSLI
jgi:SpoVK/Ycf46/Vps4 family AAA+-type ATPase